MTLQLLNSLPPKQAYLLLLKEKRRRLRARARVRPPLAAEIAPGIPSLVNDPRHPYYTLMHGHQRFKVFWGGRGAAKSLAIAEAIVRIAVRHRIRVLCVREFQISMRDSSYKVLQDTVRRLRLDAYFTFTKEGIRTACGSEIIFKGMHANEDGIRSTQGIDICWVEEAHSVSSDSWRALIPTVRGGSSQIWVSYNLIEEGCATHQRFVADPLRTRSADRYFVRKINYDENPFFPGTELEQDMLEDRATDQHLYEHVWLGFPLRMTEAMVLHKKYIVDEFSDDLWKEAERLHFGADFGYSTDPSTLIREFVLPGRGSKGGDRLFIDHEAYGHNVELDEYDDFYGAIPESRNWPIKADSAQPAHISHIRLKFGYNISGAEKWPGSVEDGIKYLRHYDEIVIHKRCVQTANEARLWRWKVDKKQLDEKGRPVVLPILVQKHDHCWDASRYGLDGHIQRSGELGMWERLGRDAPPMTY